MSLFFAISFWTGRGRGGQRLMVGDRQEVFNETYILELAVSSYYSQISHFSVIVNPG